MSAITPTNHVETCVDENIDCSSLSTSKYRSMDGRCNNVVNPRWGSAGSRFGRMAQKSKNISMFKFYFKAYMYASGSLLFWFSIGMSI
jgi:hypothetical protein